MENKRIPDLSIEYTGGKKSPDMKVKGTISLPVWDGYFLYSEEEKLMQRKTVNNGEIRFSVTPVSTIDNQVPVSHAQTKAYYFLIEQQQQIKTAILEKLQEQLPHLQCGPYRNWEQHEVLFPKPADLTNPFDFKEYLGPAHILIYNEEKEEMAYVIWSFNCRWDPENGIQAITHKERILEIAPDADPWIIYKDNGTYEERVQQYEAKMAKLQSAKKWWEFWR